MEAVHKLLASRHRARPLPSIQQLNQKLDSLTATIASASSKGGAVQRMLIAGKRAEMHALRSAVLADLAAFEGQGATPPAAQAASVAGPGGGNAALSSSLAARVGERFDRLDHALAALDTATPKASAIENARAVLWALHGQTKIHLSKDMQPTVRHVEHKARPLPAGTVARPPYVASIPKFSPTQYALAGDGLLALASAPPAQPTASVCSGLTSADLAPTPDAPSTNAAIAALAQQLNYSPAQIYQYVYNNIAFQPYYGSLKGALATLQTMAGGPTDQASLLIALLRASNIPARYVRGNIAVIDPTPDADGGRVGRWVGAKSYNAAFQILINGNFAAGANVNSNGVTNGVQLSHVWVEACVPYSRYRGFSIDVAGERWIPLDPSFKDQTYQSGIAQNTPFDYSGYLGQRLNGPNSLVQDAYGQQVLANVRTTNPSAGLADIPYTGTINQLDVDILPPTLPYDVNAYTPWAGTTAPDIAALPDSHRYRLYISDDPYLPKTAAGENNAAYSAALPDIAASRLTISFRQVSNPLFKNLPYIVNGVMVGRVNAQVNDSTSISSKLAASSPSIPCFYSGTGTLTVTGAINTTEADTNVQIIVVPVLRKDGVDQSLPAPVSVPDSTDGTTTSGFAICSTDNTLTLRVGLEELTSTPGYNPVDSTATSNIGQVNSVTYNNISAASDIAIQAYAQQGSDALIAQRAALLSANINANKLPTASETVRDDTEGEFLHLVGLKYMRHLSDEIKFIGQLDGGSGQSGIHLGLVTAAMDPIYVFDLPYATTSGNLLVDVRGGVSENTNVTTGLFDPTSFALTAFAGSAYESYSWQENAQLDAISTVRGLQYANESGKAGTVVACGIDPTTGVQYKTDIATGLPCTAYWKSQLVINGTPPAGFTNNPSPPAACKGGSTNLGYLPAQLQTLDNYPPDPSQPSKTLGCTAVLPKCMVNYSGWIGTVYAQSCPSSSAGPSTGLGIYMAIGPNGGGYAVDSAIGADDFSYSLSDPYNSSDYVAPIDVPSFLTAPAVSSNPIQESDLIQPPLILPAANGITSASTFSGDPVNLVSGNLYHSETDISIKGRGGLPIVFSRSYNSNKPTNGPLGYGWTHNFNAMLKFYGTEKGKVKLSWIDGTGAEKFFSATPQATSGTGSNIPAIGVIPSPAGVYATMSRLADGTYQIVEKNGLTYHFSDVNNPWDLSSTSTLYPAAAGASTAPAYARLLSITDRNGNALTLSYSLWSYVQCTGTGVLCGVKFPGGYYLTAVGDALGHQLVFSYNGIGADGFTSVNSASAVFNISQIQDTTGGRTYKYFYDSNTNLTSFQNPLAVAGSQQPVTYSYYAASTTNANLAHLMQQYTMPRGNGMHFEYYANGRVFRQTAVLTSGALSPTQVNVFTYNDFSRETVQTDERGGEHHYYFDAFGNTLQVVDPDGAQHTYTYDCNDPSATPGTNGCKYPYNRLSETTPDGLTTNYTYVSNGNVNTVTKPSGAISSSLDYNTFSQPQRLQDGRGNWTVLIYDGHGNLTDTIHMVAGYTPPACGTSGCTIPQASQIVSWSKSSYDSYGNLLSRKQVRDFAGQLLNNTALSNTGPIITFGYDSQSLNATSMSRIGIANADASAAGGTVTTVNTACSTCANVLSYDALGRMTNGVDDDWYPTQFAYDQLDRPYQATDKLGKLRTYSFDANGNATGQTLRQVVASVNNLADSGSVRYDDADHVVARVDAAGNVTAYGYDAAGNLVSVTNADNYTVSYEYDSSNRRLRSVDQAGHSASVTYTAGGKILSGTDPNGDVTQYTYWDATRDGRLKTVTYPLVSALGQTSPRSISYDYDANGNTTTATVTPAAGTTGPALAARVTSATYDELNRPVRVVGPQYTDVTRGAVCPVTTYQYDGLGDLINVKAGYTPSPCTTAGSDSLTLQHHYAYDDFGRRVASTDGLSRTWTFVYDANNNLKQVTDSKTQITKYTWGTGHQLLTRTDQSGRTATYNRNILGQVLSVTYPEVNYTYTYDTDHRLTTVTDSRGNKTLTYKWSPGGLLNSVTDGDGRQTSYLYDPVGRMTGITAPNGDSVAFQFDAGGRLIQRDLSNGIRSNFVYNEDNSLRQLVNRTSPSTIISEDDYTYDGAGNRYSDAQRVGSATVTYTYSYDELNRLTTSLNNTSLIQQVTGYDALDNIVQSQVGTAGQMASAAKTVYSYDAANELTAAHLGSVTGTLLYSVSYDANGNVLSDGTRSYTWDALDQLVQVGNSSTTVAYGYDSEGQRVRKTVAGGNTSYWQYDGQNIYATYAGSWSQPSTVYTMGGADNPLIAATVTGASSYGQAQYYHADGLGSVMALSDKSDSNTVTERYDPWGNVLSGSTVPQSAQYGYTGREPDETGLVYMRARYYSPSVGRFVSRDPAGMAGGLNAYAYCGNNPLNCTDPTGMLPSPVMGALENIGDTIGNLADAVYYVATTGGSVGTNSAGANVYRPPVSTQNIANTTSATPALATDTLLSAATVIPGVNIIAGAKLTDDKLREGDYAGAAVAALSIIPIEGVEAGLANVAKAVADAAELARTADVVGQTFSAVDAGETVANGVETTTSAAESVQFHHPWPMYLGGPQQQLLEPLPTSLHIDYHTGLDQILPRQIKGGATQYYSSLPPAEQAANLNKFQVYTQGFDRIHGTNLWDAAMREGILGP